MTDTEIDALLDSAVKRPYSEPLTENEQLAMLIYSGYTDEADMLDYDCD